MSHADRIFNFSAGPAGLPTPVLKRAQEELLNYGVARGEGIGMSIMEISHRSKTFDRVLEHTEAQVRKLLQVPDDYAVLFLQGGAQHQFLMVPLNLYQKGGAPVDVIHTGHWVKKALKELKKIADYRIVASSKEDHFCSIPKLDPSLFNASAPYVHLCSNNTIFGTRYASFPDTQGAPIVADMSSEIFSRKIDVSQFGLIFAGAQKNIGPSGLCLVIMKKSLAERVDPSTPTILQYREHIQAGSRYNTPNTFAIYLAGLVMDWIESEGGVEKLELRNEEKATALYDAIDRSSFFYAPVISKQDRSRMNVVFRMHQTQLEPQFIAEAEAAGLSGLKGHREAGGLRASIYNAMPIEGVERLIDFMSRFEKAH